MTSKFRIKIVHMSSLLGNVTTTLLFKEHHFCKGQLCIIPIQCGCDDVSYSVGEDIDIWCVNIVEQIGGQHVCCGSDIYEEKNREIRCTWHRSRNVE